MAAEQPGDRPHARSGPAEMNGGDAVVAALVDAGVDTVFGIPASHVVEAYDALGRSGRIRTVVARNELSAGFMADGYARRARRAGVAVVTGGPGLGNIVTSLQTAYADSSPVVVIASDLDPEQRARVPLGIPHEAYDQEGMVRATGSHVTRADTADEIWTAVNHAVTLAEAGRHRPAVCLVARGAFESSPTRPFGEGSIGLDPVPSPLEDQVKEVARKLADAERPVVLAGAGVLWSGAEGALAELLQRGGFTCVTSVPGRPAVEGAGCAGSAMTPHARRVLQNADLVLAVGTSFGSVVTHRPRLEFTGALVHVDVDPSELGRHYRPDVGVVADAGAFLDRLTRLLDRTPRSPEPGPGRTRHPWIDAVEEALPTRASVVGDVNTILKWLPDSLTWPGGRHQLFPWNFMTMGWALGAAIGAKAAAPSEPVLAVVGDGGLLTAIGELAAVVENQLPVCVLVFNNHSYGTIANLQDQVCDGRRFGVNLAVPDFVSAAASFGMASKRVDSSAVLGEALASSLARDEPCLIEAMVRIEDFTAGPIRHAIAGGEATGG